MTKKKTSAAGKRKRPSSLKEKADWSVDRVFKSEDSSKAVTDLKAPHKCTDRRPPPDMRDCRSEAENHPCCWEDAFLVHPKGSINTEGVWTPTLSAGQWLSAKSLLDQGFVLGCVGSDEEVLSMAVELGRRYDHRLVSCYDSSNEAAYFAKAED